MKSYPQFIPDGNVQLQQLIESFHRDCIVKSIVWLAASVLFFLMLLIGITFEIPFMAEWAILELLVSGVAVSVFCDIPKELQ